MSFGAGFYRSRFEFALNGIFSTLFWLTLRDCENIGHFFFENMFLELIFHLNFIAQFGIIANISLEMNLHNVFSDKSNDKMLLLLLLLLFLNLC